MRLQEDDHTLENVYQELAKTGPIILAYLEDRIGGSTNCFWPVMYETGTLHTTGCKAKAKNAVW